MNYLWKGIAIAAMWVLIGALAFSGREFVTGNLLIGLAVIAFFGTWAVSDAGFSESKCSHNKHKEDDTGSV
jgi:hypothetical protein